jgi:purine-binding chemotaxis protein CheW
VSTIAADPGRSLSVCLCEVTGRVFAIEITQAREVRRFDGYTAVPLAPPHLLGMANLRGAIVPIVELRVLLALPGRAPVRAVQTLVVEAKGVRTALAVDDVLGIESLDPEPEPGEAAVEAGGLSRGSLRRGDEVVPILDIVKVVESLAGPAASLEGQEVR